MRFRIFSMRITQSPLLQRCDNFQQLRYMLADTEDFYKEDTLKIQNH